MCNKTGSVDAFVKKYSLPAEAKLELQVRSREMTQRARGVRVEGRGKEEKDAVG